MRDVVVKAAGLLEGAAAMHREGRVRDAEAGYRRVLALDPTNPGALGMLGVLAHGQGDADAAERLIRASLSLKPSSGAWYNLGRVYESRGDVPQAMAALRQAAALDPGDVTAWSAAIFLGDLHPFSTPAVRLADRRTFNDLHCAALTAAAAPHDNDRDPDRKLRVGYLGADFIDHSAGLVFEPVLKGHDREAVEVFLYWQQRQKRDAHTERFRGYAGQWRIVNGLTDEALADLIRFDSIDILVDLAGYSNGHRLLALARKPAPIIMTGWGHVTGLGIDASDYLIADAVTVPEAAARQHHERVLKLPCLLAFDPRPPYPDVAPPPAARNGYTTFGYFGRASKMSEPVWAAWAEIMALVPDSRLILKSREYTDASYRQRIVEFFASLRVSSSRLEFRGASDRTRHLEAYADIDIALDAFPQTGGVTVLESCLMGVPSVTLTGDHLNGRVGTSILHAIGEYSGVAGGVQEYIEVAVWRASVVTKSIGGRQWLRDALLDSIICDAPAYARATEALYRQAWREWGSTQEAPAPTRELVTA